MFILKQFNSLICYAVNSVNYARKIFIFIVIISLTSCTLKQIDSDASPSKIHIKEAPIINGAQQALSISGNDSNLPVLLVVHGGLGTPYSALSHFYQKGWEDKFIVVNWEQRGSGRLYNKAPKSTINSTQLVSDTIEVSHYLKEKYGNKKIYIMGHSWGSYLAYRAAYEKPELYQAYIGVGQTINILKEDIASHDWALNSAIARKDVKAIKAMQEIGIPPYKEIHKAYEIKYGLVTKYGGFLYQKDNSDILPKLVMSSPEYNLFEKINYIRGMHNYEYALFNNDADKIWKLSIEDIKDMKIPIYFIFGKNDQATPMSMTKEYLDKVSAPKTKIYEVDKAAHFVFIDAPDDFTKILEEIKQGK